jgi:PIN domain nuclease of toxin-antitoxin system
MSAILLDTCALLWLGFGDKSLSLNARQVIEETDTVYVSPISLWEIANKRSSGGLTLQLPTREWFAKMCEWHKLSLLPLSGDVMIRAGELPKHHKDPADRIIIAAALDANLTVVTGDRRFPEYGVTTIC